MIEPRSVIKEKRNKRFFLGRRTRFAWWWICVWLIGLLSDSSRRLGRAPPWQSYIRGWWIYLLCLVFQLSWCLMSFGYGSYSKSLRTGSMRPSGTQRRRWRKRGLEILQHGSVCCFYLACPLQRQTLGTRWDLNLLQWAVAPQRAWIIYIIGHFALLPALRQMQHQLFPGPLKSDDEIGKRWNAEGFFWWNRWRELRSTKADEEDEMKSRAFPVYVPKSFGSKRCWEAFFFPCHF